ncbi:MULTISPECIES: hypothetical protein [unclassified Viridibacillus]|nr:hypothetical protein [Viridibacillus sp. FSL H8-0123]
MTKEQYGWGINYANLSLLVGVVVIIAIILISCFLIRRKRKQ